MMKAHGNIRRRGGSDEGGPPAYFINQAAEYRRFTHCSTRHGRRARRQNRPTAHSMTAPRRKLVSAAKPRDFAAFATGQSSRRVERGPRSSRRSGTEREVQARAIHAAMSAARQVRAIKPPRSRKKKKGSSRAKCSGHAARAAFPAPRARALVVRVAEAHTVPRRDRRHADQCSSRSSWRGLEETRPGRLGGSRDVKFDGRGCRHESESHPGHCEGRLRDDLYYRLKRLRDSVPQTAREVATPRRAPRADTSPPTSGGDRKGTRAPSFAAWPGGNRFVRQCHAHRTWTSRLRRGGGAMVVFSTSRKLRLEPIGLSAISSRNSVPRWPNRKQQGAEASGRR